MILNDKELELTRDQLANVETILESFRCRLKPKNERTYNVMTESWLELQHSLQADIDIYLAKKQVGVEFVNLLSARFGTCHSPRELAGVLRLLADAIRDTACKLEQTADALPEAHLEPTASR